MKQIKQIVWVGGLVVALAAAAVLPTVTLAAGGPPEGRGMRGTQGAGQQAANPVIGALDADEVAALTEFLVDEHKALATYASVIAQFGEVQPFVSIARAEERHIAALERVFARYDVALPAIPDFSVPAFASPEDAAAAGVQAESDNAPLYDALLATIDNADVLRVVTQLRDASLNNHLTALESYIAGTYVPGQQAGLGGPAGDGARGTGMQGRGTRGLGSGVCLATGTVQE